MGLPAVNHEVPEGPWMRRLRESNWIWLCKEQQYASVAFPWQPPEPGHVSGRLVLTRFNEHEGKLYRGETQVWFVGSEGKGFDGKQLVLPCEGQLSETMAEIVDRREADLLMTLERLDQRTTNHHVALWQMSQQVIFLAEKLETLEQRIDVLERSERVPPGNSRN